MTPTGAQVIVWHAGSMTKAFQALETDFLCQTGIQVQDNSAYSLDMLRQVTAGGKAADIVAPADFRDIDYLLKPAGYADYNIKFAGGKMVMAYIESDIVAKGLSDSQIADGAFSPPADKFDSPASIPNVVPGWYNVLLQSNIAVGGPDPSLDPGGYWGRMVFRLAQSYYKVPNLYGNILTHFVVAPPYGAPSVTLGQSYDFQFLYESSAYQAWLKNPVDYRYVNLPDQINLGDLEQDWFYQQAVLAVPDLFGTGLVSFSGTKVIWGVTVLRNAPNKANAVKFLQYLLGPDGQGWLHTYGPTPIVPAQVSPNDYRNLPTGLRSLVTQVP
ncbi:MAG: substrate-binding domain-containing protein [Syntrophorhabdales bacterium]